MTEIQSMLQKCGLIDGLKQKDLGDKDVEPERKIRAISGDPKKSVSFWCIVWQPFVIDKSLFIVIMIMKPTFIMLRLLNYFMYNYRFLTYVLLTFT